MADVLAPSTTALAVKTEARLSPTSVHVAHRSRGRVRLRLAPADRKHITHIAAQLRGMPSVTEVDVHPNTGSVIVHHRADDAGFFARTTDLVENAGLFVLVGGDDPEKAAARLTAVEKDATYLADHSKTGKLVLQSTEHLNRAVKGLTDGWIDLRVLLPAAVGISALVFAGVETAPLWVPLALFSVQSFNTLHQPHRHASPVVKTTVGEETVSPETALAKRPVKQAPVKARSPKQA